MPEVIEQVVAPSNEGNEIQPPMGAESQPPEPTTEELKSQLASLKAERDAARAEQDILKKHLSQRDRAITKMSRDAQAYEALAQKVDLLNVKHDALAEAATDETQDGETKRANYQAKVSEAQQKAKPPEWTPAQVTAAQEMREILTQAGIDPTAPPEELNNLIEKTNQLFWGHLVDRALTTLEAGVARYKESQKPDKLKGPNKEEETKNREMARGLHETHATPAITGAHLDIKAFEVKGIHNLTLQELSQYRELLIRAQG